jgi:membrane protease YdiL (CAAX protease family)
MSAGRQFLAGLTIAAGYIVVRALVYAQLPVNSVESWCERDAIMCLPRFIAFILAFEVMRRRQSPAENWKLQDWPRALLSGAILTALCCYHWSQGSGETFTLEQAGLGIVASIFVGFWEEAVCRGVLFNSLRELTSVHIAIFGTSFLFTIFHIQAQAVSAWPGIFLIGIIFASLRARGMSLLELALIHSVVDAAYFFFPANSPGFAWPTFVRDGGLILYALRVYPCRGGCSEIFPSGDAHSAGR